MVNPIGGSSYGANIPPSSIDQDIKTFIDDLENFSARIERHESISPEEWEKLSDRFRKMAEQVKQDPFLPNRQQLWAIFDSASSLFLIAKLTYDPSLSDVVTNALGFAVRTVGYVQRNLHSPESSYPPPPDLLKPLSAILDKIYPMALGLVKYTRQDVEELYQELLALKMSCESRPDVSDVLRLALENVCVMLQSLDKAWNMPGMEKFRDTCLLFVSQTLLIWIEK